MKVGDLVRQRFNGRWDDVGLVVTINRRFEHQQLAKVMWCMDNEARKDRMYRTRDLELVNECR